MTSLSALRRPLLYVETAAVAACCLLVIAGLGLMVLTSPGYTSTLASALEVWKDAGVDEGGALDLAESVRAYVTEPDAEPLPVRVDGREGFSADAVSHLEDVRAVIAGGRAATGIAAALLATWLVVRLSRRERERLAAGLRAGGAASLVLLALVAVAGLVDFEAVFSGFHSILFEAGTWTFPADSLLIRLFPLRFWAVSALSWAALTALGGSGLLSLGTRLRRRAEQEGSAERV